MKILTCNLPDVLIIEPKVFYDKRGFFMEAFNQKNFAEAVNKNITFVQDNHSSSHKNVARGLHYQVAPHAQGKLVRVLSGAIFDIVVDIRTESKFFGSWFGIELSADNFKQLWVPEGFAHGFITISEKAELLYKTTDFYNPNAERVVDWQDKDISIKLPNNLEFEELIFSDNDINKAKSLSYIKSDIVNTAL